MSIKFYINLWKNYCKATRVWNLGLYRSCQIYNFCVNESILFRIYYCNLWKRFEYTWCIIIMFVVVYDWKGEESDGRVWRAPGQTFQAYRE